MKCGNKLPDEAKFCRYCGFSTEVKAESEVTNSKKKSALNIETEKGNIVDFFVEESVKNSIANPFGALHKKTDSVYIDKDFHGGLARKNIGGEYLAMYDRVEGGKWGFTDVYGKEIIPVIYDQVSIFKNGLAKAILDGKCGMINKKGKEVIPLIYSGITDTSEGLTAVCKDDKWGFIDDRGKNVIPFKYSHANSFENGMAKVCKNGKWGFINRKDRVVIPFSHNEVNRFEKENSQKKYTSSLTHLDHSVRKSLLYICTFGITKAWAAFFGEVILLLAVNYLLPENINSTFWSLVGITIVVSFILFFIIIDTIIETKASRNESSSTPLNEV